MPQRKRASKTAGKSLHAVAKPVLDILYSDLQLTGPLGAGAWRLRTNELDDVVGYLTHMERNADRNDSNAEGSIDGIGEEPGSVPLQSWSPSSCRDVLKIAALVVRWPAFGAWLPLRASPGAAGPPANRDALATAALARQELVYKLRQLGLSTVRLLDKMLRVASPETSCHLACALLSMHTLQACSRSLAETISLLPTAQAADHPVPGPDAADGASNAKDESGGASSAVSGGGPSEQLLHTVRVSGLVLHGVASVASRRPSDGGKGGSNGGLRSSASPRSWRTELVALLCEALPGSGLVEHLARGVLHLLHSHGGSRGDIADAYTTFMRSYVDLGIFLARSPKLRAVCGTALGGRRASFLATAAGLQLLCTADAGPSYGMLESSWAGADVVECMVGEAGRNGNGGGGDGASMPGAALLPLTSMLYALLYKQPRHRVLTEVFERTGHAALASARHAELTRDGSTVLTSGGGTSGGGTGGGGTSGSDGSNGFSGGGTSGGSGTSGGGGGNGTSGGSITVHGATGSSRDTGPLPTPPGLQLSREDADRLAQLALKLMQLHVQAMPATDQLAARRRWWRLAFAWVAGAGHWPDQASVDACVRMLHIDLGELPEDGTLPRQPSPALAVALSGGLLPCLERIVRRAGEVAQRPARTVPCSTEQQLLKSLLRAVKTEYYLCWLLAYGSPAEAAALVVSLGKLLRVVAAEALPGEDGAPRSNGGLALHALLATSFVLTAAQLFTAGDGAADGGPVRQLRRMVPLAACEWLPVMSGFVLEAAKRLLAAGPQRTAQRSVWLEDSGVQAVLASCLSTCARWLPTKFGAAPQAGRAGLSAQGGTEAGVAGWAALRRLAGEARVVELVGSGMRLVAYLLCGEGKEYAQGQLWVEPAEALLGAAYGLALHSPGEVRRALAVRPAGGVLAHCTWSSEVVRTLSRALPVSIEAIHVRSLLSAWERGQPVELPNMGDDGGLLVGFLSEAGQPCPLRRCSWWRCTHLAGDSEAGVERSKCGGCGREWYCGQECQAAHWRAGHKAECGGKG